MRERASTPVSPLWPQRVAACLEGLVHFQAGMGTLIFCLSDTDVVQTQDSRREGSCCRGGNQMCIWAAEELAGSLWALTALSSGSSDLGFRQGLWKTSAQRSRRGELGTDVCLPLSKTRVLNPCEGPLACSQSPGSGGGVCRWRRQRSQGGVLPAAEEEQGWPRGPAGHCSNLVPSPPESIRGRDIQGSTGPLMPVPLLVVSSVPAGSRWSPVNPAWSLTPPVSCCSAVSTCVEVPSSSFCLTRV